MAKRGGTKRKIAIKKIVTKEALAATYCKRTFGIYSKASQLCLLNGSQIAILATPPSSESNASLYTFGHSSVETVVDAFLKGTRPVPLPEDNNKDTREDVGVCLTRMNLGLGNWWDDEKLQSSENPQELKEAMESIAILLKSAKKLNQTYLHEELAVHATQEQDQALDHKKETELVVLDDDSDDYLPPNLNNNNEQSLYNNGEDLNKNDVVWYQGTQEQYQGLNFGSNSDNLPLDFNNMTEEQAQIAVLCQSFCDTDNNNNYMSALTEEKNLLGGGECSNEEEMDIDQINALDSSLDGFEIPGDEFLGGGSLLMSNEAVLEDLMFLNSVTNLGQDDAAFIEEDVFFGGSFLMNNEGVDQDSDMMFLSSVTNWVQDDAAFTNLFN